MDGHEIGVLQYEIVRAEPEHDRSGGSGNGHAIFSAYIGRIMRKVMGGKQKTRRVKGKVVLLSKRMGYFPKISGEADRIISEKVLEILYHAGLRGIDVGGSNLRRTLDGKPYLGEVLHDVRGKTTSEIKDSAFDREIVKKIRRLTMEYHENIDALNKNEKVEGK
ncbi:MAG: hypothetical protein AABX01_05475 [Candidatus Micrarchaeota archaeon]